MLRSNWRLLLLLLISSIALYIHSGAYGVVESSDARYAEISREMFVSGDYLHPDLLDVHHYHKPPLTYQITALSFGMFGINAFGARFFLQLAVLIQMVLVFALGRLFFESRKTAFWAAAIYFSFPLVLISTRNLTTDVYLNTFVLFSLYAWVKYRKQHKKVFLYLFTLGLALGFLTKGPVVFIVPLPFILAYNRVVKTNTRISFHHFFAWLLFLIVGFSWYLYLVAQNTDFLNYFLGKQTVDRFARDAFDRTEPFWYFLVLAPAAGIPWLLILPVAGIFKRKYFRTRTVQTALLIGIVVPLIFFSISSSKRILYILPFYSLAALLTAYLLTSFSERGSRILSRIMLTWVLLFCAALIASFFLIRQYTIPPVFLIAGIIGIPLFIAIHKAGLIHADSRPVLMNFLLSSFLVVASSKFMAENELKINSPAPLTDFVIDNHLEDRPILVYNTRKPSIAFELNKSIISLYDGSRSLVRETQFETDRQWKKYLVNLQNEEDTQYLKEVLQEPAVLITYKNPVPQSRQWLLEYFKQEKSFDRYTIYY